MSPTTPTISMVGNPGSGSVPSWMSWPTASFPGKYWRAIDSLTTTTCGAPSRSRSDRSRPFCKGTPSTPR